MQEPPSSAPPYDMDGCEDATFEGFEISQDVLHSIDWESPQFQQLARSFNDGLMLPVFDNAEGSMWK
jgi:hypothetical protein